MKNIFKLFVMSVMILSLSNFAYAGNNNGPRFGGDNDVTNNNLNLQAQGQLQGQKQKQNQFQGQGQSQSSYNKNKNTNKNTNTNFNVNSNSNKNTAVGVGVSSANNKNSVDNDVSNKAVNKTTNNVDNTLVIEGDQREFPNQGNVTFGSLVSAYSDGKPSEQFIKLEMLTMYSSILPVEDAKEMIDGNFFGKRVKIVPTVEKAEVATEELNLTGEKIDTELYDVKVVGFGVAVATSDKTISAGLLAKAVVDASEYGATHLQFLAEGTTKQLQASGWGIGFSSTKADSSNTIQTGGTGYSSAKSSYAKLPWQQFMVLKVTKK